MQIKPIGDCLPRWFPAVPGSVRQQATDRAAGQQIMGGAAEDLLAESRMP